MGIYTKRKTGKTTKAFTIVELLIVIVVIAILAAVTIVAYQGVKKRAVASTVQSSLQSIAQKLETEKINNPAGEYPAAFPEGVTVAEGVGFALTTVASASDEFCVNGTALDYNDLTYHIDQQLTVTEGLCEGEVIVASIIGDYNESAGQSSEVVYDFARSASGDGTLGLVVSVPHEWDGVTISWDAQPNAARYEVQSRNPSSSSGYYYENFSYRAKTDGSGYSTSATHSSYSGQVSASTTQLTWTDTAAAFPRSTGQSYEYRVRWIDSEGVASQWDTAALSNAINASTDIPEVTNFTVTPNSDYTNVTLSWDETPGFSPRMDQVWYELRSRNPSSSAGYYYQNFSYRAKTDGGGYTTSSTSTSYSGSIAYDTTSLTWTHPTAAVPTSTGQNYEYQIRVRAQGQATYHSDWSDTITVSNPIQTATDIPEVTNFSVTPNADYTNTTLSWDQIPNFSPRMDQVTYEVQSRNPSSSAGYYYQNFSYRAKTDGSGYSTSATHSSYSGSVPHTTTSLTWTDTATSVPSSTGQNYEYRIRIRIQGEKTYYSDWSNVATVSHPIQASTNIPEPTGFSVTPNGGWSSVTLSWNQIPNFSPDMQEVWYEVQSRNQNSSAGYYYENFSYRAKTDGSSYSTSNTHTGYSGTNAYNSTSLTWTDTNAAMPAASGQTYDYRIRLRVQGESTYYSDWVNVSLTR